MIDLGPLGGTDQKFSQANAVNGHGLVAGFSSNDSGEYHAFAWTQVAGMVDLGTLGGDYSYPVAVNDAGQVVGVSNTASGEYHPFLWASAGGMVDLGTL